MRQFSASFSSLASAVTLLVVVPATNIADGGATTPWNVSGQSISTAEPYSGNWSGSWASSEGFVFAGEMTLARAPDGSVNGQIIWTFEKSPLAEDLKAIGSGGIEYVKGTYDPATRVLVIEGTRKADPSQIISLDKYRLVVAENGVLIAGVTWNNGNWRAIAGFQRHDAERDRGAIRGNQLDVSSRFTRQAIEVR